MLIRPCGLFGVNDTVGAIIPYSQAHMCGFIYALEDMPVSFNNEWSFNIEIKHLEQELGRGKREKNALMSKSHAPCFQFVTKRNGNI